MKEWLDIGMKTEDAGFCAWLRDEVRLGALEVLNSLNRKYSYQEKDLKEQYKEYLEDSGVSGETTNLIFYD